MALIQNNIIPHSVGQNIYVTPQDRIARHDNIGILKLQALSCGSRVPDGLEYLTTWEVFDKFAVPVADHRTWSDD